jgi:hypothetical protein
VGELVQLRRLLPPPFFFKTRLESAVSACQNWDNIIPVSINMLLPSIGLRFLNICHQIARERSAESHPDIQIYSSRDTRIGRGPQQYWQCARLQNPGCDGALEVLVILFMVILHYGQYRSSHGPWAIREVRSRASLPIDLGD